MVTGPRMCMACASSAGTQMARNGGTAQVPEAVATVITPQAA
jgi:hypothetical protein